MKIKLPLICFLIVFGCTLAMAQTFFRDKIELSLKARTNSALASLKNIQAANIVLDFDGPYATLQGEFFSSDSKNMVLEKLALVPGLRGVTDSTSLIERAD